MLFSNAIKTKHKMIKMNENINNANNTSLKSKNQKKKKKEQNKLNIQTYNTDIQLMLYYFSPPFLSLF